MPDRPTLNEVQRWFQAVVTHPGGVAGGVSSEEARRLIDIGPDELRRVVRESPTLSAERRLAIYANAYYARLLECLRESFPVLCRALGENVFNDFAFGYLQHYPPRSYSLDDLGDHFARYLDETRPDCGERAADGEPPAINWPDFLIDLANLEWAIARVFDGPGVENTGTLRPEQLHAIPAERWPGARLVPAVCLKLLRFRYPVNSYYTEARRAPPQDAPPFPQPAEQFAALTRRDYIVRRYPLSRAQHTLLDSLRFGRTVGEAIARAADLFDGPDEQLAAQLQSWFRTWAAEGFFAAIEPPGDGDATR